MPTKLYSTTYYFWYNRLKKLRKGKHANPENAAAFEIELEKFRKEGITRKTAVKNRKMPLADFSTWLAQQQNFADKLMDDFTKRQ
jgi:hypothetical protein